MNAHPDLTGLVGECTSSAPGVAKAVREAGRTGKVFTVGLGTPQAMKPYLKDGSSSAAILWDVEKLGYLTVWAAKQLHDGKKLSASNQVNDDLTDVKYYPDDKMLLLGDPLRITAENVDKYNY
jgi:rhamnose transport system substrate-binding protein